MPTYEGTILDVGGAVFNVEASAYAGTDDTARIQNALDAAVAAGGGTVYFPARTYTGIRGLLVEDASNIKLQGEKGATLKYAGLAAPGWDKIIRFTNCTDIVIEDLAFDNWKIDRFGGLEFYDCRRVWINRNHFYNSEVTANPDDADRRSIYFWTANSGASNNSDIWITNNLVEDLQLEVHASSRVLIQGNECFRGAVTGGILCICANFNGQFVEDVRIVDNYVEDADGTAIYVVLEGSSIANTTLRGLIVSRNRIKLGQAAKSLRGIMLGSTSVNVASTGNVLHDAIISENEIWVTASSTDLTVLDAILVSNGYYTDGSGTHANWDVQRVKVIDNLVRGNGTGNGIGAQVLSNSDVVGNRVYNCQDGVGATPIYGCRIQDNTAEVSRYAFSYNCFLSSGGNNVFRGNQVLGSPSTRYNISNKQAGDYVELERLEFEASYAGGTIADGAGFSQDITVTNASMGSPVAVGVSTVNTGAIQVTGNVVSANTVRVTIFNHSGASRTFGAGTIRGFVTRLG